MKRRVARMSTMLWRWEIQEEEKQERRAMVSTAYTQPHVFHIQSADV